MPSSESSTHAALSALPLKAQVERLALLYKVGISLSAEKNKDRLVEMILLEAKKLCHADGGTLYTRSDDEDLLQFDILHTDSLGLALGGTSGVPIDLPPIPLFDSSGARNMANVASYAALVKRSVCIDDAYHTTDFDFSGMRAFDQRNGYRSQSFLTIPLINEDDRVIGVLQLINARDVDSGQVVPFRPDQQQIVEALASQAAVALDNQMLRDAQDALLDSFIQVIATAIDAKSAHTGAHCERVPIIAEMLVTAACETDQAPFDDFALDETQWRELRIASWLHDCGKIVTPVHVMDKGTKLEVLADRMEVIRARFEVLGREAELRYVRAAAAGEGNAEALAAERHDELAALAEDLAFLERANVGGEYLNPDAVERIHTIGSRRVTVGDQQRDLLSAQEIEALSVARGTLTEAERLIINGHMVQTINMLRALPFPRDMSRVPEYAGGHHERMDGTGYPRGLFAADMSVPARALAIADVFEALTAQDRPYKPGKTLSEAMRIMGFMKRDNHIDPDLFDLFVRSRTYQRYGEKHLPIEQLDEVDEAALLAIQPKPITLPPEEQRRERWTRFLSEYEKEP